MRILEPKEKKMLHSAFYDFEFDDENRCLDLTFRKDLSSKAPTVLPERLVDVQCHTDWHNWLKEQDEDALDDIFYQKAICAIGFEDTDQEVVDITMSRNSCVLMVKQEGKGLVHYTINLDKYPSIKQTSVWDDVGIYRGIADGKLYAYWLAAGLCVEIHR